MRTLLLATTLSMVIPQIALADQADIDKKGQAKLHYEAGDRAFRLGDFSKAVQEFKASFDASGVPLLLYNIAQAYRQMGDSKQALFFYQQFLATEPTGDARRITEQRISELKIVVDQQQRAQKAPPTGTAPPSTNARIEHQVFTREANAKELRAARTLKLAGYATGGFGIVALGLGGMFTGLASNANGQIIHGSTWVPSNEDRRNTYQALDATFFAVGGAAFAVGLTLYLAGNHNEHRTYREERDLKLGSAASSSSVAGSL